MFHPALPFLNVARMGVHTRSSRRAGMQRKIDRRQLRCGGLERGKGKGGQEKGARLFPGFQTRPGKSHHALHAMRHMGMWIHGTSAHGPSMPAHTPPHAHALPASCPPMSTPMGFMPWFFRPSAPWRVRSRPGACPAGWWFLSLSRSRFDALFAFPFVFPFKVSRWLVRGWVGRRRGRLLRWCCRLRFLPRLRWLFGRLS